MKALTIGILAHVDAGKTTLSESILFHCKAIRTQGRVDRKDTFLDHFDMEKERGITVFAKEASVSLGEYQVSLLDTPGHVDFSAEMERGLWVMDYGILVINGMDGIQAHTRTLWNLLKKYGVPTFLFINKMDTSHLSKATLEASLTEQLGEGFVDFGDTESENFYESIAMEDERGLEEFLNKRRISQDLLRELVAHRKIFPCFYGSALKNQGVDSLLEEMSRLVKEPEDTEEFGARVYKISMDKQGVRETHLKITSGTLHMKDSFGEYGKVNQIRIYSGGRYESVSQVSCGMLCRVTGLSQVRPSQGLGMEADNPFQEMEPVISYCVLPVEQVDVKTILPQMQQIGEELPEIDVTWKEDLRDIQVRMMGEIQQEMLQTLMMERYGIGITFGPGKIRYKETITKEVEGVGHFEPLKHYAEVHLLLTPGESGSGIVIKNECREDSLEINWQKQIINTLKERELKGVLTGSGITDLKITFIAGKGHETHTESGDFQEATIRALRQGLKKAESLLLEPYYHFVLEVPSSVAGRAMYDIETRYGSFQPPITTDTRTILEGQAPVATLTDYHKEVLSYTSGEGKLVFTPQGYGPCHNASQILEETDYVAERDPEQPTGSIFCYHGVGNYVEWNQVEGHMHVESPLKKISQEKNYQVKQDPSGTIVVGDEEIEDIMNRTFFANRKGNPPAKVKKQAITTHYTSQKKVNRRQYLLVDGYNIVFAWEELSLLAKENLDAARGRLLDILSDYRGIYAGEIIVVFDAYKVAGGVTKDEDYHNIHVVFTKEAETADRYIERFAHTNRESSEITVATSDGVEQIIIQGQGCNLLSAREFKLRIQEDMMGNLEIYQLNRQQGRSYLAELFSEEILKQLGEIGE